MKKLFCMLFVVLGLAGARGAEQVELFLTLTNTPVTGDTLTINATTRTWTNAHSTLTILTNLADFPTNTATTNLYFNLSAYFLTELPIVRYSSSNELRLIFGVGTAVTASEVGNWVSISYVTNTITTAQGVRVPITVESVQNRTNIASGIVEALQYATNSVLESWVVGANFAGLTLNNVLTGTNSLSDGGWNRASITNLTTLSGVLGNTTNGVSTNHISQSPIFTNAVNYGNAFRSPGVGSSSEQFGLGATADGANSTAVGNVADASAISSLAVGHSSSATQPYAIALGNSSAAVGGKSLAIGVGAEANGTNSIAFGTASYTGPNHTNSVAIGNSVSTTETNQVLIGTSTHKVRIPGRLEPTGTTTNATHTGYLSVGVSGASGPFGYLALRRYNNTSLANGNNSGVIPGDAAYMKVSGPSAAFSIHGVTNWVDGRMLIIQNSTTFDMTIANDSGTDPQAANRIYTGTGADVTVTNSPGCVTLIYDSQVSRWVIVSKTN